MSTRAGRPGLGCPARARLGAGIAARAAGASDTEIHDTVLIAAAFCMYNRYVDGLATVAPDSPEGYAQSAQAIVEYGYLAIVE